MLCESPRPLPLLSMKIAVLFFNVNYQLSLAVLAQVRSALTRPILPCPAILPTPHWSPPLPAADVMDTAPYSDTIPP